MPLDFFGDRLRFARHLRGLTLAQVASNIGVSRQYIHQLEAEDKAPTAELVVACAEVLDVAPSFFSQPIRNAVKADQVHFRKLASTSDQQVNRVLAFATLWEPILELLDRELDLPSLKLPTFHISNDDEIEAAASACRTYWKLSTDRPLKNITRVIENAGVPVVEIPGLEEKVDALSVARGRPIIVRNPFKQALCRQRLDLGHELGHLVLHQAIQTGDKDKETERQAFRFAGAFLFPRDSFEREFPNEEELTWRRLFELKLKWKISVQALLMRARDLEKIGASAYERCMRYLSHSGQRKKEKFDDELPLEKSELIQRCFDRLAERGGLRLKSFADALDISPTLLREVLAFIDLPDPSAVEDDTNVISIHSRRLAK
jgi:Zn-dependent peptidase ImmA (M78 family)/transcriptional regulator with XRE-family HTH domain